MTAVQQTIHEEVEQKQSELILESSNGVPQCTQTTMNLFDVDITNPMDDIDNKYEYFSERICVIFPKLSLGVALGGLSVLIGNLDKLKGEGRESLVSTLAIIASLLMIILCATILIYQFYKAKSIFTQSSDIKQIYTRYLSDKLQSKLEQDALSSAQIQRQIWYDLTNTVFGIPKEEGLYSVDRTKFGVALLGFVIYASTNIMLIESIFPMESTLDCEAEQVLQDPSLRGICVANKSTIAFVYAFVYALFIIGTSYYYLSAECFDALKKQKENIEGKIKENTKIWKIYITMNDVIQNWNDSQRRQNRKLEYVVVLTLCIVFEFTAYGVMRNQIFSGDIDGGAVLFSLYCYIGDAIILSITAFYVIENGMYFYSFPGLIMKKLSHAFKANCIKDIVLWWELRQFYLYSIIAIYASGMSGVIFVALIGSVILAVFAILFLGTWETTVIWVFLFWTVMVLGAAFKIVSVAVNFHLQQLSHAHTINKERLRLDTIQYYQPESAMESDHPSVASEVIDIILDDIAQNDHPIVLFGLAMNSEFMLFLRGSVITLAIAAYFGA